MRAHVAAIGAVAYLASLSTGLPICRPQTNVPTRQHGHVVVDDPRCAGIQTYRQRRIADSDNDIINAHETPTIHGERMFQGSGTRATLTHEYIEMAANVSCGIVVKDSAQLTVLHSTASKPAYAGGSKLPGVASNAAFCVTNHSKLHFNYGAFVSTGHRSTGVWVSGDKAEAHLSSLAIGSSGSPATYGLVASNHGHIYATKVKYDAENAGGCAFVSEGGTLNIGQSKARTKSVGSSVFCSEHGEGLSELYANEVAATSDDSAAAWLFGPGVASFTNCDIKGGGPGAIIAAPVKLGNFTQTRIRIVDSNLTATGAYSSVFLLGRSDVDIRIYNTKMTPSDSGIIAATVCFGPQNIVLGATDCEPFTATITVSESNPVGDIEPRWPSNILWALDTYSLWTGGIVTPGNATVAPAVSVFLDDTSAWEVTRESWVQTLRSPHVDLANIYADKGIVVHYNASAPHNAYLGGRRFILQGGGSAEPY